MKKSVPFAVFVLTALVCHDAFAREYQSPDGALNAIVDSSGRNDCEAVLSFRMRGKEILRHSYRSRDHEHGSCIATAKWTPDSKYFVFTLESSGGHQPWHTPIDFFSRRTDKIDSLERYLADPITEDKFSVSEPDVVELTTTKIPLFKNSPARHSVDLGKIDQTTGH